MWLKSDFDRIFFAVSYVSDFSHLKQNSSFLTPGPGQEFLSSSVDDSSICSSHIKEPNPFLFLIPNTKKTIIRTTSHHLLTNIYKKWTNKKKHGHKKRETRSSNQWMNTIFALAEDLAQDFEVSFMGTNFLIFHLIFVCAFWSFIHSVSLNKRGAVNL